VYLAEAGTGHVYRVDVTSGEEERISNITIPTASRAVFSPDGQYAAVVPNDSRTITVLSLPVGTSTVTSTNIEARVVDLAFSTDNLLLYTERSNQTTLGYAYNPTTTETNTIFTIPFRESVVIFGETVDGPHYTYPKTAEELEGYVYTITNGALTRLPISGFGLSIQVGINWIIYSKIEEGQQKSYLFDQESNSTANLNLPIFPEKCLFTQNDFVCAISESLESLTAWYRGEYVSSDSLFYITPTINDFGLIEDISQTTAQMLDTYNLQASPSQLFFMNRTDNMLWVYERDFIAPLVDN
jgi:hypothetical protein